MPIAVHWCYILAHNELVLVCGRTQVKLCSYMYMRVWFWLYVLQKYS